MILEKSSKMSHTPLFPLFVWNTVARGLRTWFVIRSVHRAAETIAHF